MSNFEQMYGSLSYTDGIPDYYGLPLEQINKTYDVLNKKYELNSAKWNELRNNIATTAVLTTEKPSIDKALGNAQGTMKNIVETGNFHMADNTVNDAVYQFITDNDVKEALKKKASKESFYKDLDDKVKSTGADRIEARVAAFKKLEWESKNQNYTAYGPDGTLANPVITPNVVAYKDVEGEFLKLEKEVQATDYTGTAGETVRGIRQDMNKLGFNGFGEYYQFIASKKGVGDNKVLSIMNTVINKPEVQAYLTQERDMALVQKFGIFNDKKQVYDVGNTGHIMMRDITEQDLKTEGMHIITTGDNKTLVKSIPKRNAKGQTVDKNDKPTTDESQFVYNNTISPIVPGNEQSSYLSAIASNYSSNLIHKYNDFATNYSYYQTAFDYKETSNKALNEHNKIKKADDVQMMTQATEDNYANNNSNITEKDYNSKVSLNAIQGLQNSLQKYNNGKPVTNLMEFYTKNYHQILKDSQLENDKGSHARNIISSFKAVDKTIDNNNNFAISKLQAYRNNPQIGSDINHVLTISNRFTKVGAPLSYLNPDGKTLNSEGIAYCTKNNIKANVNSYEASLKLTPVDVASLRSLNNLDNKVPKGKTFGRNSEQYIQTFIGGTEAATVDFDKALGATVTNALSNKNTNLTIISSTDGTDGFNAGETASIENLTKHLADKYKIDSKIFYESYYNTFNKGTQQLKNGEYIDRQTGKKVSFKLNKDVAMNYGKNYTTITVQVTSDKGEIESSTRLGMTIGSSPNAQVRTNEVKNYEKPELVALNTVQSIQSSNNITRIYNQNVTDANGNDVNAPGLIYEPNDDKTFLVPKSVAEQNFSLNNPSTENVGGIEYVRIKDPKHAALIVNYYNTRNVSQ